MAGKMAYRLKVVRSLMPYTKGVKRFFILIFISKKNKLNKMIDGLQHLSTFYIIKTLIQ